MCQNFFGDEARAKGDERKSSREEGAETFQEEKATRSQSARHNRRRRKGYLLGEE